MCKILLIPVRVFFLFDLELNLSQAPLYDPYNCCYIFYNFNHECIIPASKSFHYGLKRDKSVNNYSIGLSCYVHHRILSKSSILLSAYTGSACLNNSSSPVFSERELSYTCLSDETTRPSCLHSQKVMQHAEGCLFNIKQ